MCRDPEKIISAKIFSIKQLGPTKTTYEIFLKILEANHEEKKSYKQLELKNWKQLMSF